MDTKWTSEDSRKAASEGWDVFSCNGSLRVRDGWLEIERCDETAVFECDYEALAYVATRAAQGSDFHKRALDYVDQENSRLKG